MVEAAPAITFVLGGLMIGPAAPCGLLAAGADTGGTYFHSYLRGLANALVFGLAAGPHWRTIGVLRHTSATRSRSRGRARLPASPSRRRAR